MAPWQSILTGLSGIILMNYCGTIVMAVAGHLAVVRIREVALGVGRKLFRFETGSIPWSIGLIPFTSYVQFSDNRFPELQDHPKCSLDAKPAFVRLLIPILGLLSPFLLACPILGAGSLDQLLSAIPQIIGGALSPNQTAQSLLQAYAIQSSQNGYLWAGAIAIIKAGTFMLIPLNPAAGLGQVLCALRTKPIHRGLETAAVLVSFLMMAAAVSWLWAIATFLIGQGH